MTPVSIRLTDEAAAVQCDACQGIRSLPTGDRNALVLAVRTFLASHHACTQASAGAATQPDSHA
jgi:hypothetical protein